MPIRSQRSSMPGRKNPRVRPYRARTRTENVHRPETDHVAGVDGGGVVHAEVVAIGTDVDIKNLEPAGVRNRGVSEADLAHACAREQKSTDVSVRAAQRSGCVRVLASVALATPSRRPKCCGMQSPTGPKVYRGEPV
jgi:hypothetical protein